MSEFREKVEIEKRIEESSRIIGKYPDRAPIIVEPKKNTQLPDLDKHKYLVPKEMTVGQFMYVLRRRLKLKKDQAIFVFVDNKLPVTSELIERLYDSHKNEDGFLYMVYAGESTFG